MKSVQNGFHSCTTKALPQLLAFLNYKQQLSSAQATKKMELQHRFDVISMSIRRLCNHTRRDKSETVWNILFTRIAFVLGKWKKQSFGGDSAAAGDSGDKFKSNKNKQEHGREASQGSLNAQKLGLLYSQELSQLLQLLHVWVTHRHGSRIYGDGEAVLHTIESCVRTYTHCQQHK
jgi:hypothetical protein